MDITMMMQMAVSGKARKNWTEHLLSEYHCSQGTRTLTSARMPHYSLVGTCGCGKVGTQGWRVVFEINTYVASVYYQKDIAINFVGRRSQDICRNVNFLR